MEMAELSAFPGLKPGMWYWLLEILLVVYPNFWHTLGNLETAEIQKVYAALSHQEVQICLY